MVRTVHRVRGFGGCVAPVMTCSDLIGGKTGRSPAALRILQPVQTVAFEALRPLVHTRHADPKLPGHLRLFDPFGATQDNRRAQAIALRRGRRFDAAFQLLSFRFGKVHFGDGSGHTGKIIRGNQLMQSISRTPHLAWRFCSSRSSEVDPGRRMSAWYGLENNGLPITRRPFMLAWSAVIKAHP